MTMSTLTFSHFVTCDEMKSSLFRILGRIVMVKVRTGTRPQGVSSCYRIYGSCHMEKGSYIEVLRHNPPRDVEYTEMKYESKEGGPAFEIPLDIQNAVVSLFNTVPFETSGIDLHPRSVTAHPHASDSFPRGGIRTITHTETVTYPQSECSVYHQPAPALSKTPSPFPPNVYRNTLLISQNESLTRHNESLVQQNEALVREKETLIRENFFLQGEVQRLKELLELSNRSLDASNRERDEKKAMLASIRAVFPD